MDLTELVERCGDGVFHICAVDPDYPRTILGSGTGFWCRGYLITNHHVMSSIELRHAVWVRRERDADPNAGGILMSGDQWRRRIKTSSSETSYDYAVMDVPELATGANIHDFDLQNSGDLKVGAPIAFLGYPLEHQNLTCHSGIISSFYKRKSARIIQIDGSVNAGNSGGPLLNIENGKVIGVVSRKATGLSKAFTAMRSSLQSNIDLLSRVGGSVVIDTVSLIDAIARGQRDILYMTHEIERQSNVGIGYAFSAAHLLDEEILNPD